MASSAILASALSGALPGKTSTAVKVESLCLHLQPLYSHQKSDKIDAAAIKMCESLGTREEVYNFDIRVGLKNLAKIFTILTWGKIELELK